jgi:integrase/recombinase XerD
MGSLGALVHAYLDHLVVERGVSKHTVSAYRRDLHRYQEFLATQNVVEPDQVRTAMISDFAVSLAAGEPDKTGGWVRGPLASASVARAVVAVRSLHRFAVQEGLSVEDPADAVIPPNPPRRLPKALTVGEIQSILDVPSRDTELGLRDLALLELLYGTGVRISEAVALDVDDVSRALGLGVGTAAAHIGVVSSAPGDKDALPGLRVLGKGNKERIVPLGTYARLALDTYLTRSRPVLASRGGGSPALFLNVRGGRLSRQSAWTILQTTAARAGVGQHVSPHTMRHSFATHLLDGGADVRVVQELLGHASVTTTQIYTLVTVDHLREVYITSHPRAY